jgi:hypothetical protein
MSKNTNECLLDDFEVIEKRSLIQRYLQNPFSITWSKLTSLLQAKRVSNQSEVPEVCQFEYSEQDSIQQQDLYPRFTDRIDPSVYYCIFFPHQWY